MMAIASGVITLFILFFGEIMPKTFATRMAAPMAIVLTPVYRVLMIVLWPITTVIYRITSLLSRDKLAHAAINDGEIEALLELSKKQ